MFNYRAEFIRWTYVRLPTGSIILNVLACHSGACTIHLFGEVTRRQYNVTSVMSTLGICVCVKYSGLIYLTWRILGLTPDWQEDWRPFSVFQNRAVAVRIIEAWLACIYFCFKIMTSNNWTNDPELLSVEDFYVEKEIWELSVTESLNSMPSVLEYRL